MPREPVSEPALVLAHRLQDACLQFGYTLDTVPNLTPDNGLGEQGAMFEVIDQRGARWRVRLNRC